MKQKMSRKYHFKERDPLANWILESESSNGRGKMTNGFQFQYQLILPVCGCPEHCTMKRILRLGRKERSDQLVMSTMDVQIKQHALYESSAGEYHVREGILLDLKKN